MVQGINLMLFLLFLMIMILILTWWNFQNSREIPNNICISTNYNDIISEFDKNNNKFYMEINVLILNDKLRNSDYEFDIIDSNYKLIYNNRSKTINRKLNTFEITEAVIKGKGFIVRDKIRFAAFKVSDCKRFRIVRISGINGDRNPIVINLN